MIQNCGVAFELRRNPQPTTHRRTQSSAPIFSNLQKGEARIGNQSIEANLLSAINIAVVQCVVNQLQ